MAYTADISCVDCHEVLLRAVRHDELAAALVLCHAAVPHCNHTLAVTRLPHDPPGTVELRLECLHPQCQRLEAEVWELRVDPRYVAAYVVAFHTSHEGHRLRMTIDGRTIESPKPR